MKALNILFIVILTYLTMSCAMLITDYDYDYDREANFARLRTFAWRQVKVPANALVIKHIKGAVNRELEAKGFMKNKANPDFLIAIRGKKVKKTEGGFYDTYDGYYYEAITWQEGTITLTMRDAKSKAVIWRGTARGRVAENPSSERRRQRIDNAIARILNNFPPPKE